MSNEQIGAIETGIWMIGLGLLFATGYWWPGIMFVIGLSVIVAGWAKGHGWYALQSGLWTIGIGVWAIFNFNIAVLFVILGVSALANAFIKPPFLAKPYVDNTLE